jgi:hypothetical protein
MKFTILFLAVAASLFVSQTAQGQTATARDTADYPADPRPIVVQYFESILSGDAGEALQCWDLQSPAGSDAKYEQTQIRNTIAELIAEARLERAVKEKLPALYAKMEEAKALTPTPERIRKANFTTFRRLAVIRWSEDEDAGLPLVLDTNLKPPRWKISLSHYRETTRASVGDSFRASDVVPRSLDKVTQDILAGIVVDANGLAEARLRHLEEELKKMKP